MDDESVSLSRGVESDAPLYGHSPGLTRLPLGNASVLIYCPYDRTRHVLSAVDAGVLQTCRDFSTVGDHTQRNLKDGGLDEASIRATLQRLIDARLLVAQRDLIARCMAQRADDRAYAKIASLCIPTRNRPEMLLRCMESYARCARDFARDIEFVIIDSSDDKSIRERNVGALTALKETYGVAIRLIEPDEKRDFAQRLARRGLDPRSIDFALLNPEGLPIDTGANRNALLLSTVDECTVQVDDDTICRVMPWNGTSKGVRFTSRFNPTEYVFLEQEEDVPAHRFEPCDFFALHESLLGRSPSELIEMHGLHDTRFERPSSRLFRWMERGGARVSVTALGVVGDSGMSVSDHFLQLDGQSRANLMRSERVYRDAVSHHRLIRAAQQVTVSDDAYCMALNVAVDNRRLMPPFMPVQRGQDDIFGALLRSSSEGSCFGFLPWALAHAPPPRQRPGIAGRSVRMSVAGTLYAIVRSFRPIDAKGPEGNLSTLGRWLRDLGREPTADFEELARIVASQQASKQIAMMEGLLERHRGHPQFWAADVEHYIGTLKESITREDHIVPRELEEVFGADSALVRLQRLVLRLGELLEVWPDMRQAAREERASGIPIGRQI